jgi:hypothetical protein
MRLTGIRSCGRKSAIGFFLVSHQPARNDKGVPLLADCYLPCSEALRLASVPIQHTRIVEKERALKVFLDCEFTQLNQYSKLISVALVSESDEEFYVELTDTYSVADCSDFVIQTVLPQLDLLQHGQSLIDAQASLRRFLGCFDEKLEVCSDAPNRDWKFFCDLVCADHQPWPAHVVNQPTNLTILFNKIEAEALDQVELSDPPHHALLDARMLAELFKILASRLVL